VFFWHSLRWWLSYPVPATRQWLPLNVPQTYDDVKGEDVPFVEAVSATGAALKDLAQTARGVMLPTGARTFSPNQNIRRVDIAFSLIQSLGLESEALARNGSSLTVQYGDARVPIDDALDIPAELRGYVQLSLDLNVLNAYFFTTQGAYDLQPTVHATFKPRQTVTRGDYAVAITRYFHACLTD
jgi:serine protease AprX